jgi:hypothetical protein
MGRVLRLMWDGLSRNVKDVYLAREMQAVELYQQVEYSIVGLYNR